MSKIRVVSNFLLILCISLVAACGQKIDNEGVSQVEIPTVTRPGTAPNYGTEALYEETEPNEVEEVPTTEKPTLIPTTIYLDETLAPEEATVYQTPQPNIETFSVPISNQKLPEDLMKEVNFFIGGGESPYGQGSCNEDSPLISAKVFDYNSEFVFFTHKEVLQRINYGDFGGAGFAEYGSIVEITTCGWVPNESVHVSVTYPNGHVNAGMEKTSEYDGVLFLFFVPQIWDPEGIYYFSFTSEQTQTTLEYAINVRKPVGPRIYDISNNIANAFWKGIVIYSDSIIPTKDTAFEYWLLYNFEPGEHVRVIIYGHCNDSLSEFSRDTRCLVGSQDYYTNSFGELVIQIPQDSLDWQSSSFVYYSLLGDFSGEFRITNPALVTSFETTIVDNGEREAISVRQSPSFTAPTVGQIRPGTYVEVVGNANNNNNEYWSRIRVESSLEGWVPSELLSTIHY